MKILIVTNHFWPENFRINDLAVGLHELAHEVTVFTGIPDYPEGRFHDGYGVFKRRSEVWMGVRIVRFARIPRGRGRSWNLVLNYLSAALMACIHIVFLSREKFDLTFVFETSPVTIGLPALILRRLHKVPVVFWVLDLWPESLSATGAIRSTWILNLVRRLVRFIYQRCDRILISSKGFSSHIRQIGGYEKEILYFPNWIEPDPASDSIEATADPLPDLPTGFRILFAGNIGSAQDFPTILRAAELLRDHSKIHWVILGTGRKATWVQDQVELLGLQTQFHLLGRFPAARMPEFYACADALLLALRREPIFSLTVPGKVQSYLASGKPIIASLDGEGAELIDEAGAGLSCPAESPEELAARVLQLYRLGSAARLEMGRRGRAYSEAHFDREQQFVKLVSIMGDVVAESRGQARTSTSSEASRRY